jgi:4-hydroxy-tetrahydrodipicolinate synthase
MSLTGVINILTTPFDQHEEIDETSLRQLVEHVITVGVTAITVLGVAGEAHKLTETESDLVLRVSLEQAAGRVPVLVGTSRPAARLAARAASKAADAGAAGVMVAPPAHLGPGEALTAHFRRVAEESGLPIVLQDFPPATGVTLTPRDLAELVAAVPSITTIKLEGTPTASRMIAAKRLLPSGVSLLGGLGGMFLLDELRAGADGTMTGYAFPEALVDICRDWAAGRTEDAARTYFRHLPLMLVDGQPGTGLDARKLLLRDRGLITTAHVRQPSSPVPAALAAGLAETMSWLELTEPATSRRTSA